MSWYLPCLGISHTKGMQTQCPHHAKNARSTTTTMMKKSQSRKIYNNLITQVSSELWLQCPWRSNRIWLRPFLLTQYQSPILLLLLLLPKQHHHHTNIFTSSPHHFDLTRQKSRQVPINPSCHSTIHPNLFSSCGTKKHALQALRFWPFISIE